MGEHSLVLKAFEKVEPTRRCFRMVGGVLVERTVGEVTPAVTENMTKIKEAVKGIESQLKKKSEQRTQMVEKYGLNRRPAPAAVRRRRSSAKGWRWQCTGLR